MRTNILISLLVAACIFCSCQKRDQFGAQPDPGPLGVSPNNDFSWSTSKRVVLNLTIEKPANCNRNVIVFMVDENNTRISAAMVQGKDLVLDVIVPAVLNHAKIVFPQTGESTPVSLVSTNQDVSLTVSCPVMKADADKDGVWDEIDEYPKDAGKTFDVFYPYTGYAINGYEDLWPSMGDYDFNDLVLKYNVKYVLNPLNQKIAADFEVVISAIGAGLHNGLGLQLLGPGTGKEKYRVPDQQLIRELTGDAEKIEGKNLVKVYNDVFTTISSYYTNVGVGPSKNPDTLKFSTILAASSSQPAVIIPDFFLFRSDNRGHEIHLPNRPATTFADRSVFKTFADNTNPEEFSWYKTVNNLSWGIEVMAGGEDFQHPLSKASIIEAYPGFLNWVKTSGTEDQNWYELPVGSKTYNM